jgi:hypothetical protein
MEVLSDEASIVPADEASVPMEPESSNDTSTATSTTAGRSMSGTLRRKVAKRTFPWLPASAAAEPLASPTPIDGDGDIPVPVAKKPRLEVPLLATTEEAATIASPHTEEAALPPADADADPMTAVSHPMTSDPEQTSRDDGSANKRSEKLLTSKPPSNASGWQHESLSAAAVAGGPQQAINGEDLTADTSLGRESPINNIEDRDDSSEEALPYQAGDWTKKYKELCEYRQSKGLCIFICQDPEYAELSKWVFSQRLEYRRMVGGKYSILTPERVKALEGIGFVWILSRNSWEDRLSELADYRKIQGHCNVPTKYSENTKLGNWVGNQKAQYRLHIKGKRSQMTLPRIQELESLGFEWGVVYGAAWEDRLSELADYRKIHGHCNVSQKYSEKSKLARWVSYQRFQHKLHLEGKRSQQMTLPRIQALESLGFEWEKRKGTPKKPSLDEDATRVRERAVEAPEYVQQRSLKKISAIEKSAAIKSRSLSNPKDPTGMAKSTSTSSGVEPQNIKRVEAGDERFDETDLDGTPSELAATPSLHSDRQAAKSLYN